MMWSFLWFESTTTADAPGRWHWLQRWLKLIRICARRAAGLLGEMRNQAKYFWGQLLARCARIDRARGHGRQHAIDDAPRLEHLPNADRRGVVSRHARRLVRTHHDFRRLIWRLRLRETATDLIVSSYSVSICRAATDQRTQPLILLLFSPINEWSLRVKFTFISTPKQHCVM